MIFYQVQSCLIIWDFSASKRSSNRLSTS